MAEMHVVTNLETALLSRLHPAITRWNRLEGRPRRHDFDRALHAEVRDALWFLSRQWQLGEFVGDDAGSPVLARACLDLRTLDRYQPGTGAVQELDGDGVLEPTVERRPVPLALESQALSLDLRMAVGRRWLRLLERDFPATTYADDYRDAYLVEVPNPLAEADAQVVAHADAWQQVGCAAGRAMDGIALIEHVAGGGAVVDDVTVAPGDVGDVEALFERLRLWFAALIDNPETDDAWKPSRLAYGFAVSAPSGESDADGGTEVVLRAEEYHQGTLDWHALQRSSDARLVEDGAPPAPDRPEVEATRDVQTFVPTQVVFDGMPNTRWWAFEDRRTNFGKVSADTTDVGTLMLMEFALVFANDWFVVPWTLPVGSLARVQGIAVTTVFDERLWVEPVAPPPGAAGWDRWSMFALADESGGDPEAELVLLPVAPKVQEGEPLEDVSLVRDEMANMVWAIEQMVPLASGWPRAGGEAAHELRTHLQNLIGPPAGPPPAPAAPIRYEVMSSVPEQWLPFVPVHVDGSTRETQLQRATMLRFLDGDPDPAEKVRPRTPLMSANLPSAYFVFEDEVPRAGVRVSQCYQRTRGPDGKVMVWYGARKQTGRGEGSSGLGFDRIVDSPTE
ncbi:hypothetical protein J2X46_002965 [Nocardioides sp. BE266]|uniref:hypothetical protein n=1 Tax=Nocardioides sp. BE266 TaxID=2817725 RepID=UPI00285A1F11|nr:hypothetical protein [Nocardioides sp. BE266]MDR7253975.1 hypothetical protein [Nocardioides sp. BE266]